MTRVAPGLRMLQRRADFVAASNSGVKIGGPLVSLQMRDRANPTAAPRVGFTATKRVGGSVERSRMKRRMRAAASEVLSGEARAGCDYVLVARRAVLDARFARLLNDLRQAIKRAHGRAKDREAGADASSDRRESGR